MALKENSDGDLMECDGSLIEDPACCDNSSGGESIHPTCTCPSVVFSCVSEHKTARVCGHPEYTDAGADPPIVASSPPKGYLREVISGTYHLEDYAVGGTCDGEITYKNESETSHELLYSPDSVDCGDLELTVLTSEGTDTVYDYDIVEGECVLDDTTETENAYGLTGAGADTIVSRTNKTLTEETDTAAEYELRTQDWTLDEITEDTEADAAARVTGIAGTSCSSIWQTRSSGFFFDKRTSEYTLNISNLVDGLDYRVKPTIRRKTAVIGTTGTWEDVATDWYEFTASGTTEEVGPTPLTHTQGYEYEITGATVQLEY